MPASTIGGIFYEQLTTNEPEMTKLFLMIGTGGFIGSVCRYFLSQPLQGKLINGFPTGTLVVNIIGCFVIGIVFGLFEKGSINNDWRLFLATGICGGFTTFSAFSIETVALLRGGHTGYAFLYIGSSVILGLLATFVAYTLFKLA
jgi:CrcB protein